MKQAKDMREMIKRPYERPAVTAVRIETTGMIATSDGPGAGIKPPTVGDDGSDVDDESSGDDGNASKHYNPWEPLE